MAKIATMTVNGSEFSVIETENDITDSDAFLRAAKRAFGASVKKIAFGNREAWDMEGGERVRRAAHQITAISRTGDVLGTAWVSYK